MTLRPRLGGTERRGTRPRAGRPPRVSNWTLTLTPRTLTLTDARRTGDTLFPAPPLLRVTGDASTGETDDMTADRPPDPHEAARDRRRHLAREGGPSSPRVPRSRPALRPRDGRPAWATRLRHRRRPGARDGRRRPRRLDRRRRLCAVARRSRGDQSALQTGEPVLLGLAPDPETVSRPGLDAFPMTCHSGGVLELFVDPILPTPRLVVVGDSPLAHALARLANDTDVRRDRRRRRGRPPLGCPGSHRTR